MLRPNLSPVQATRENRVVSRMRMSRWGRRKSQGYVDYDYA